MRRAMVWLITLGLLGITGWWFLIRPQQIESAKQPTVTVSPLVPAETQRLEKALNSDNRSTQAKVMSSELAKAYLSQNRQFLPNGATLRLKPETFATTGNAGRIEAELKTKAGATTSFWLVLVRNNGGWKLLNTEGK